jgi:hypothetical protein
MLVTTQNEIQSLMPTARWDKPQVLFGYLEEEEAVALEPLLGASLYQHVLTEYDRLRQEYIDITATTVRPTGKAKQDPRLAHADVTERLEQVAQGKYRETYTTPEEGEKEVPAADMKTIQLIRICQRIEWYRMLANKAGLLTISFNEGGGMNISVGESYDAADEKAKDRAVKDALGGAGRAIDSLLLFLEADAKGEKLFTEMWQEADAFYLNKDLLFQTATVLDKFLDIKSQRMAYVSLVRDIRFCQDTYLEPRIGARLLEAVVDFANNGGDSTVMKTLLKKLRIALAFYVESRRTNISRLSLTVSTSTRGTGSSIEKEERLARRDSMTDAQQAMAMACDYIAENLEALGDAAVGTPIYNIAREREAQAERERQCACAAEARRRRAACEQSRKRLFTAFPATHRTPEVK